ncbi:hypothetical protein EYF80_052042 [Liparis tanakae]|uniref:Uncharacterized protein n=1 Tax=Liparis tanakae TaxID=230148 RepID=A0A4Z2FAJ3_9TELE|nr:hypothetical protein EYF80_052042 [Liparis tanakae]
MYACLSSPAFFSLDTSSTKTDVSVMVSWRKEKQEDQRDTEGGERCTDGGERTAGGARASTPRRLRAAFRSDSRQPVGASGTRRGRRAASSTGNAAAEAAFHVGALLGAQDQHLLLPDLQLLTGGVELLQDHLVGRGARGPGACSRVTQKALPDVHQVVLQLLVLRLQLLALRREKIQRGGETPS